MFVGFYYGSNWSFKVQLRIKENKSTLKLNPTVRLVRNLFYIRFLTNKWFKVLNNVKENLFELILY